MSWGSTHIPSLYILVGGVVMGIFPGVYPLPGRNFSGGQCVSCPFPGSLFFSLSGASLHVFSGESPPSNSWLNWWPKLFQYIYWGGLIWIFLGEVVFLENFSKGFPHSSLWLPWGSTHIPSLYILSRGWFLWKIQGFPPLQAVAALWANAHSILALGPYFFLPVELV